MNPINEYIYDRNISRQISLIRHRNGLNSRVENSLRLHDLEFASSFELKIARLTKRDVSKLVSASVWNTDRLKSFSSSLDDFVKSSYLAVVNAANQELDQLTKNEYDFQQSTIMKAYSEAGFLPPQIKSMSISQASSYRRREIVIDKTQREHLTEWSRRRRAKLLSKIRFSLRSGRSLSSVMKSIRGTDLRFSGILKDTQLGALMVVDTLHVSATSAAALALKELNSNIRIDFLYSALLDGRSSGRCFTRHNRKVFEELNGVRSPIHFRCRTRLIPFIGDDSPPENNDINGWFRSLSVDEKIDFLGPTKFEIYNNNKRKFSLMDFISDDSELLTISQLEETLA